MAKIIISYRRSDSDAIAGRIRDKLASYYGDDSIFMDIDSIPFGLDFREHVKTALLENDILIAVIGPKWVGLDSNNRSRISEETDPVRIEVETALKRAIPVVPVLVGGANMPLPAELPDGLRDLAFRNAAQIDAGRDFHQHMERLIRSMDRILEAKSGDGSFHSKPSERRESAISGQNHIRPIQPKPSDASTPRVVTERGLDLLLAKYGLRFLDPEIEKEFSITYREQFYSMGQAAVALAVAGWLVFGSTALVASQGKDLDAIKFFFVAAPVLLGVFFAGFSQLAKQNWQGYYAATTLVFIAMAYVSAHVLQDESWFRPEYVTMTFMAGVMVIAMAPVVVLYAVVLQSILAGVALYYIVFDLRMMQFPTLYAIFSSLFLSVAVITGWCITVTREKSLRREFSAIRRASAMK